MKIKVEVDLTPIEARRLLGLPDVEPLQEAMMNGLMEQMQSARGMLDPEAIIRMWGPMGAQGLEQLQKVLWSAAKTAMDTVDTGKKKPRPASRKKTKQEEDEVD